MRRLTCTCLARCPRCPNPGRGPRIPKTLGKQLYGFFPSENIPSKFMPLTSDGILCRRIRLPPDVVAMTLFIQQSRRGLNPTHYFRILFLARRRRVSAADGDANNVVRSPEDGCYYSEAAQSSGSHLQRGAGRFGGHTEFDVPAGPLRTIGVGAPHS